ncbi:7TM diverse intracellular signaling domain-containing protein [Pseudobacteriovorax antillogorgiicola]|nr:7TM diverse intracellular signaling domain-containing protein [Pseudobacteriovorax antillogorgiicola]
MGRHYLLLLVLIWPQLANSVELEPGIETYNLGPEAEFLRDESRNLEFTDVVTPELQTKFQALSKDTANFGFNTSAFWFKLPVKSNYTRPTEWVLAVEYSLLDYVDLYYLDDDGTVVSKLGGDRRSFDNRDVKHRYTYFKLRFSPSEGRDLYLRVQTEGSAEIPLKLMSAYQYAAQDHESQFGQGIFVGLMLIMGMYYLIIGIGAKNREYLFYAFYVFALAAFKMTMNGVTMEYVWGDSIWFTNAASALTTPLVFFAAGLYTYVFLDIRKYRYWNYAFIVSLAILGSCAALSLVLPYKFIKVYTLLGLLFDIVLVASSAYCYRKGFKPAKYFMISWFALIAASVVYGLQKFGVLPVTFLSVYSVELSAAFQALTLAVGQTAKINEINRKIRHAQKEALEAQIETNRVTEMMKTKLESLVAERTADLWAKNQEIKVMMDSIKQGICTVDDDLKVKGHYSGFMETILGSESLEGKSLMRIVFEPSQLKADELSLLQTSVKAMIGEDILNFEANQHVLPSSVETKIKDTKVILEFDWAPVANQNDEVGKLLVSIRDVTELYAAREEARSKEEELAKIGKILKLNGSKFTGYIKSCFTLINDSRFHLNSSNPADHWTTVLRNIHTIKGNSRTYGFDEITETVHRLEDYLFSVPKNQISQEVVLNALQGLGEVVDVLNEYREINDHTLERSEAIEAENTLLRVTDFLKELADGGHLREFYHRREVTKLFDRLNYLTNDTFQKALRPLMDSMPSLAEQLGKPCPEVVFEGEDFFISKEGAEKYEDMFVHLIRNSMDHGFQAEKRGRIFIHIEKKGDRRLIKYRDSGKGLNLQKLRIKANESGVDIDLNDDQQVAEQIFESGVSCSEMVTDISGRGVGMEAVKSFVYELGGQVDVELGPELENGFRAFSLIFDVPAPDILKIHASVG